MKWRENWQILHPERTYARFQEACLVRQAFIDWTLKLGLERIWKLTIHLSKGFYRVIMATINTSANQSFNREAPQTEPRLIASRLSLSLSSWYPWIAVGWASTWKQQYPLLVSGVMKWRDSWPFLSSGHPQYRRLVHFQVTQTNSAGT